MVLQGQRVILRMSSQVLLISLKRIDVVVLASVVSGVKAECQFRQGADHNIKTVYSTVTGEAEKMYALFEKLYRNNNEANL